jgi:hypothetical protein
MRANSRTDMRFVVPPDVVDPGTVIDASQILGLIVFLQALMPSLTTIPISPYSSDLKTRSLSSIVLSAVLVKPTSENYSSF